MRYALVLIFLIQHSHADILVRGPDAPLIDYRAALKADSDLQSPSQFLARQNPTGAERDNLLALFSSAQKSFLENAPEQAAQKFREIAQRLTQTDWSPNERRIFLHSLLRLAQLEVEAEKQTPWLQQALLTGPDLTPEAGLFPPPLLQALHRLKVESMGSEVPSRVWDEGWEILLINGFACTPEHCPSWPQNSQMVRVTLLSDIWQPVTMTLESGGLKDLRAKKKPWITGDCQHTQYSVAADRLKDPRAFWSLNCGATPTPNLQPVLAADPLPRLHIQEKAPAFYKSKWFWVGVGGLITAAIIINENQKKKEETEPSTTYGY